MNTIHTCAYRPTMHINEKRSPFQTEVDGRASDWPFCFSAFQSQSQYLVSGFLLIMVQSRIEIAESHKNRLLQELPV